MAKLTTTTVYGDLTVTGVIKGTVSSTFSIQEGGDVPYIPPLSTIRITDENLNTEITKTNEYGKIISSNFSNIAGKNRAGKSVFIEVLKGV